MSLEEKNQKEKKVIEDIFEFISTFRVDSKENIDTYFDYFRELFRIEMDFYGEKYSSLNLKENDLNLDFVYMDVWGTRNIPAVYKPKEAHDGLESIEFNTHMRLFDAAFSVIDEQRVEATKVLISTLFHEMRHHRQRELMRMGYPSIFTLRYIKEVIMHEDLALYYMNHDRIGIEADAITTALTQDELFDTNADKYRILGSIEVDKELAYLLTPDRGVVDRDTYFDIKADREIKKMGSIRGHWAYKTLSLEYNDDATPKRLSALISDYIEKLKEIETNVEDKEERRTLLKDLKELYFSLFNKRLLNNNKFEFLNAIKDHGNDVMTQLLEELNYFNATDKNKKSELLKSKLLAHEEKNDVEDRFDLNNGYIANPFDNFKKAISTFDFIDCLNIHAAPSVLYFLRSKVFTQYLPPQGYFVTKLGNKMSIEDYINNLLVPALSDRWYIEAAFDQTNLDLLDENFIPTYQMEINFCYETINKDYQRKNNKIKEYYKLLDETALYGYPAGLLESMETVTLLCERDKDAIEEFYFNAPKQGQHFDPSDYTWVNDLINASIALSQDPILNPGRVNYYSRLMKIEQIRYIIKCVEDYNTKLIEGMNL